jgi:hypothetical protein
LAPALIPPGLVEGALLPQEVSLFVFYFLILVKNRLILFAARLLLSHLRRSRYVRLQVARVVPHLSKLRERQASLRVQGRRQPKLDDQAGEARGLHGYQQQRCVFIRSFFYRFY